jgi:hypothetical protein
MIGRSILRAAGLLAWVAAAAVPARAAESEASPIHLTPFIRLQGTDYLIGVEGLVQLPDGTLVDLTLLPAETVRAGDVAVRSTRVSVRASSFSMPTWTLKRAELRTVRYLLEAKVAREQPLEVRVPRLAVRWKATIEIPLGDWRAICTRLAPLAREMMERVVALVSKREPLRDIALAYSENRGIGATQWADFKNRSGVGKALDDVTHLLDAPVTEITYPQSRIKCQSIINAYRSVITGMDHLLVSEKRAVQPEGAFEFWADFKSSDFVRAKDQSSYLSELETKLCAEGTRHLVIALEEILDLVDPGTEEKPRLVKSGEAAKATKGLKELLDAQVGFFKYPWSLSVEERRLTLVELIGQTQKLADESMTEATGSAFVESQIARRTLWKEITTRIGVLREVLRRELGI